MEIRAVIFDMDGLLVDSEVYWEQARQEYCLSAGCVWSAADELTVKGNNSSEWATKIRVRCALSTPIEGIIAGVVERMLVLYDRHLPLLPGAVHAVRAAGALYPLAIASSSPPALIERAMSDACLLDCFVAMVSSDRASRGKPAPDVFLVAAAELGVMPAAIAVFEDSTAGITAARLAGMMVIAVPNPHYPPAEHALAMADIVLPSLLEFEPSMLAVSRP